MVSAHRCPLCAGHDQFRFAPKCRDGPISDSCRNCSTISPMQGIAMSLLAEPSENAACLFVHLPNDLGRRLDLPNQRHTLARPQ